MKCMYLNFPVKYQLNFPLMMFVWENLIIINDGTLEENDDVELKVAQLRNDR